MLGVEDVACPPGGAASFAVPEAELLGVSTIGYCSQLKEGDGPFEALLFGGPDQHACAVFLSNMMYGLALLVAMNRG